MRVCVDYEVDLPVVPDYIRSLPPNKNGDYNLVSISKLTDDQLKKIGAEWTARLIARAAVIRADGKK